MAPTNRLRVEHAFDEAFDKFLQHEAQMTDAERWQCYRYAEKIMQGIEGRINKNYADNYQKSLDELRGKTP